MTRRDMIDALNEYCRPGSPVYRHHFRRLPVGIVRRRNVPALLGILADEDLPARVREHAAGALGEIGDGRAVGPLIDALGETKLRRGAATALGRLKAREATERLRELAPKVGAARWALSEVSAPQTTREVIDDLRTGQLRDIGPKTTKPDAKRATAVAHEIVDELEEIVAASSLSPDHRWMVTALQYLAPAEAAQPLIEALRHAIDLDGCCGCLLNRIMRALGEIRPPEAIPALVDVICQVESPVHKHLAAVCAEKIVAEHEVKAWPLLGEQAARLAGELERLGKEASVTPSAPPETPWDGSSGTPRWRQRQNRAVRGIQRLLERCRSR